MALGDWPLCLALVICNDVLEDRRSGNKSLIGLFNTIHTRGLPATHPRCYVYLSLTGFKGNLPLSIEVHSQQHEIARMDGQVSAEDAGAVADVVIELEGLPLPEEGEYRVVVSARGEPLAARSFSVELLEGARQA